MHFINNYLFRKFKFVNKNCKINIKFNLNLKIVIIFKNKDFAVNNKCNLLFVILRIL
jgi:hypothetical protein